MLVTILMSFFAAACASGWLGFEYGLRRGRSEGYTHGWRDHEAVTQNAPKRGADGRFQSKGKA